jgi:hypothetical protein
VATSIYDSILEAVASVITGLNLTFTPSGDGNPVIVAAAVLKVPKVQESLDTPLPVIAVSPAVDRQRTEPAAEGLVFCMYPVEVAISAAGNRDFASNLDIWLNWREQIRQQFQGIILVGVPQALVVRTDPDPAFDRQTAADNYDRSRLTVWVKTIEPRGL